MGFPLLALLPLLQPVLERVVANIPDPGERDRVLAETQAQLTNVLSASDTAQTQVNAAQAASPSTFASSARPAAMWVCVAGLAYDALLRPLLPWAITLFGKPAVPPLPTLDDTLYVLLFGMLGLSGLRSFDKTRGTTR